MTARRLSGLPGLLAFSLAVLVLLCIGAAAAASPARIVSLGGDVTETLFRLGQGARVVAVDDTSGFPAAAARLPRVGYLRSLAPEPILATRPDLVLAGDGAGPEAVLRRISAAGVRVVRLPAGHTPADVAARIRMIGAATGTGPAADRLAADVRKGLILPPLARPPAMILVMATAPGRVLAAGRGTAGDALIGLSGGRNPFAVDGYRLLSAEAALAANPDILLVPSHVSELVGGLPVLLADPTLRNLPAVRSGRVIVVDSQAALAFGPRLPEALARLRLQMAELLP
jgi:iron complex transport system substrate-binding protein